MDRVRKDDRNKLISRSKVSACRKLMSILLRTSRIFKRKISPSVGRSIEGSWLVLRRRIETTIEQVRIILFHEYYVFFGQKKERRKKKKKGKKKKKEERKGMKRTKRTRKEASTDTNMKYEEFFETSISKRMSSNDPDTVVVHVLQTVRDDRKLKDERNLQSGRTGNGKG